MVKLAHQFHSQKLFKDEYISWFFDEETVRALQEQPFRKEIAAQSNRFIGASVAIAEFYFKSFDRILNFTGAIAKTIFYQKARSPK